MHSHALIFSDFDTKWYKRWAEALKQEEPFLENFMLRSNKFWQNAVIAQSLNESGLLGPGKSGVGFGVGKERLPSLFASLGIDVTASDQDFRTKKAQHWKENELAKTLSDLNGLEICDHQKFSEHVTLKSIDMTNIPETEFGKYDFAWSNCALGHLGSIEKGLDFIIKSAACLKPGGIAVHTTEVNVLSDDETVDSGDTVIFRPSDIYRLSLLLSEKGFSLDPLRLTLGNTERDNRISFAPKFGNDYSKIQVGGHIATQVVLIIKAKRLTSRLLNKVDMRKQRYFYHNNLANQSKFSEKNMMIREVRKSESNPLVSGDIKPLKASYAVTINNDFEEIIIEYENLSDRLLFGAHNRLYTTKPILMATSNPTDHKSKFAAHDWHNAQLNRPSSRLCIKNKLGKWIEADYVKSGQKFGFPVKLNAKTLKKGLYKEYFNIVQEGSSHLSDTQVEINISIT